MSEITIIINGLDMEKIENYECEYEGCKEKGDTLACGRYGKNDGLYCEEHADEIANEDYPEYTHECYMCGCLQGVN